MLSGVAAIRPPSKDKKAGCRRPFCKKDPAWQKSGSDHFNNHSFAAALQHLQESRMPVCLDLGKLQDNAPSEKTVKAVSFPERTHVCSELPTVPTVYCDDEETEGPDGFDFLFEDSQPQSDSTPTPPPCTSPPCASPAEVGTPRTPKTPRNTWRLKDVVLRRRACRAEDNPEVPGEKDAPSLRQLVATPRACTEMQVESISRRRPSGLHLQEVAIDLDHADEKTPKGSGKLPVIGQKSGRPFKQSL
mmetsp:Transcript_32590/g.75402  ORF Transcript_32590/g.75402 Transcript_32590/m.75402 type:complete len:246 (-) Transcript_32590:205-942(-)